MWPRLASSHAGYNAKLRRYIAALRTAALRGLGMSRPGSNAAIHLALIESPRADPGFVVFRASVLDLRARLSPQVAVPILDHLVTGRATNCPGPLILFLRRIHTVGWVWDPPSSCIQCSEGAFCLWSVSPQELHLRLMEGSVSSQACRRAGLDGLQTAPPSLGARSRTCRKKTSQSCVWPLTGPFTPRMR